MKTKRFLALTMALSMTAGAMTVLPSAYAEGNSTDLELTVEASYTMTVPAKTIMNSDGTAMALTNGLKIKGSNMTKDVDVTMAGSNNWKMVATGVDTRIGYAVYDAVNSETKLTEVEFAKDDIMAENGSTKSLYVKPDATDLAAAEAGTYTGSITFTAGLHETTIKDIMNPGTEWTVSFSMDGDSYDVSFKTKEDKSIEKTKVLKNGNEGAEVDVDTHTSEYDDNCWNIDVYMHVVVEDDEGLARLRGVGMMIDTGDSSVRCNGEGNPRFSGFIVGGTDIKSQINR